MKTEIKHIKVDNHDSAICYFGLLNDGWDIMSDPVGNGSDDARLTGGTWLFKGNEEEAKEMQAKRWKEVKAWSDRYYAQKWV